MNDRASFALMCRDMPFICCNVSGLSINLGGGRSLTSAAALPFIALLVDGIVNIYS